MNTIWVVFLSVNYLTNILWPSRTCIGCITELKKVTITSVTSSNYKCDRDFQHTLKEYVAWRMQCCLVQAFRCCCMLLCLLFTLLFTTTFRFRVGERDYYLLWDYLLHSLRFIPVYFSQFYPIYWIFIWISLEICAIFLQLWIVSDRLKMTCWWVDSICSLKEL